VQFFLCKHCFLERHLLHVEDLMEQEYLAFTSPPALTLWNQHQSNLFGFHNNRQIREGMSEYTPFLDTHSFFPINLFSIIGLYYVING